MNPLKKGPQIKLSEVRTPQVLVDLWWDLRDRHLLPVVGLLLVGIVAVPLLLGGSDEEAPLPPPVATAPAAKTSSLVVTEEAAPLRDYERRLEHLEEKNPFVQQYTQGGGGEGSDDSGESAEVTVPGGEEPAPGSGGSPVTSPGSGGCGSPGELIHYTYVIDVRVVPVSVDGKKSKEDAYVRKDLPPLTMLPSRAVPALTYMGPSKDGEKAIMLVSSEVTALFGDSACVVGTETCQLLALEKGAPQTVVYGANARTYRVELRETRIELTDRVNRAPLGKPKPRGGGGEPGQG
ncbi:MAG TPA: hypothetical protein VK889_02705 [Solirubrobacterales bacterium]|nr:hypothetical protein [Solirubrobacterales bacterium]